MSETIHCSGKLPDDRITEFILEHHVLTLATGSGEGVPWCASCFYAYHKDLNWFVFTSDETTRHGAEMLGNPMVAASIALETKITGRIRGLQITGIARRVADPEDAIASSLYLKRFPIALLKKTTLWILEPQYIKMTDNRLGFGKKLVWCR